MAGKISKGKTVSFRLEEDSQPVVEKNETKQASDVARLKYPWTFWFDVRSEKLATKEVFLQQIQRVGMFSTYSEYWTAWKDVYAVCPLPMNSNIRMFKDGIEPMWEDPHHANGGQFVITTQITSPEERIKKTLSFLLGVVVGEYGHDDHITGAVVSVRPWGIMYHLWNKNCKDKSVIHSIQSRLELQFGVKVFYQRNEAKIKHTEESSTTSNTRSRSNSLPSYTPSKSITDQRRSSLDSESEVKDVVDLKAGDLSGEANVQSFVQEINPASAEQVSHPIEKELQNLHAPGVANTETRNSMVLLGGIAAATTVALTLYGGL